jgi:hypothetical protein
MRLFVCCAALALVAAPGQPRARAEGPDALLRDIEGKWRGKVVRDQAAPGHPVIEIEFHCSSRVPDEVIGRLDAFPRLRKLGLVGGQRLTDKGLEHVGKLTGLEVLELRNGKVTAAGLRHLAKLPKLRSLGLSDVPLSKENGAALEGLQSLEVLELTEVKASPEGLASLKKLPRLKRLEGFRCDGALASEDEVRQRLPGVKVRLSK